MKKIIFLLLGHFFLLNFSFSQHFVPVDLLVDARDVNLSIYGGLSLDGGNGTELSKALSNTTQTGFIVNSLYKVNSGRNGSVETFHQFLIDINPIIINWDPFTWNKLVKQPVDSFSVYKMPFQEDAVLHIGWHKNWLSKFYRGGLNQLQHVGLFAEMYFRPYNIYQEINNTEENFRFAAFNVNLGTQYSYVKKEVPVLGNFLIGASLQFNFLMVNETDQYQGSLDYLMPDKGKNFMGPGAKIVVQTNNLNIYVEGRQYYGFDKNFKGVKFTQEPIILVGAAGNLKWKKKKNENGGGRELE